MHFFYAKNIQKDFPELITGVITIDGVTPAGNVSAWTEHFCDIAGRRLALETEGTFPEIQAWRKAFGRMGLKPTQYRCASEALLRRFRTDMALPNVHPLVDLCNSISIAFAIPIAVFDRSKVIGDMEFRCTDGSEVYETFGGEIENPDVGEIIFADTSARAHARRWVNRQSGYSAVRDETTHVLIVTEAMHETARRDIAQLVAALTRTAVEIWPLAVITEGASR